MKAEKLLDKMELDYIIDNLRGELTVEKNSIIYTYDLDDEIISEYYDEYEDSIDYESTMSNEETLMDIYQSDLEIIEEILDNLDELDKCNFSKPKFVDNCITFKIY